MSSDGRLFAPAAVNLALVGFPCRELSCTVRPFATPGARDRHEQGAHPELRIVRYRIARPRRRLDFARR